MATTTKKAALLRVSSKMQQEGATIRTQEDMARAYFRRVGVEPDAVRWYRDEAVSGDVPIMERGDGARLVRDIEAGLISEIFIPHVDRLAREASDWFTFVAWCRRRSVTIHSIDQGLDTGTGAGRLVLGIMALMAEEDKARLLKRFKDGQLRMAREGKYWTKPPLGYVKTDGQRLEIEPEGAALVRRLFRDYAAGQSLKVITAALEREGVQPPKGGVRWWPAVVRKILTNSAYIGQSRYNTTRTVREAGRVLRQVARPEEEHIIRETPRLVDDATFHAVAARLGSHLNANTNATRVYMLRGLIRCGGSCGRNYHGRATGRPAYVYYIHPVRRDLRPEGCENLGLNLPAAAVEALLVEQALAFLAEPAAYRDALRAQLGAGTADAERELEEARKALEGLRGEKGRLASLYAKGRVDDGIYDEQLAGIAARERALSERVGELAREAARAEGDAAVEARLEAWAAMLDEGLDDEAMSALLHEMIERITVTRGADGRAAVEVKWR